MKTATPITNSLLGEYIVDLNTTAAVERHMTGNVDFDVLRMLLSDTVVW